MAAIGKWADRWVSDEDLTRSAAHEPEKSNRTIRGVKPSKAPRARTSKRR
jgi:hypothetical protein